MNKKLLVALLIIVMLGLVSLALLRMHSAEVVHAVVVNAVIQKAPEGYDHNRIREVFNEALARAEAEGTRNRYLDRLQRKFHSLEKRQYLENEEMDRLLAEFEPAAKE